MNNLFTQNCNLTQHTVMATTSILKYVRMMTIPLLIIFALVTLRYTHGILLFHTLAELFSIFVGFLMFVIVLNTQHFYRNDFLIFLGIGYFAVSILDGLHALTLQGLPFFDITNSEVTLHFWVYSRLFEAFLMLLAPFFLVNRLNAQLMLIATSLIVVMLSWSSFYLVEPVMFVDGKLSNTKVLTEFFVIFLLTVSIIVYIKLQHLMPKNVLFYMVLSMILTIGAELCFTVYTDFNQQAFVVGHIFKFFSFWMIYQAIVQTSLKQPLKLLSRRSNSYDAIPHPAIRVDKRTIISQVNRAAINSINSTTERLVHQPIHKHFHPNGIEEDECRFCQAIRDHQTISNEEVFFPECDQWYLLSISPIEAGNPVAGMVQSLTNITKQKFHERELLIQQGTLEQRVTERTRALELSLSQLKTTQAQLVESKKMASLGGLVKGVAHEINTPIGISLTASSYLSDITCDFGTKVDNAAVSRKDVHKYVENASLSAKLIEENLNKASILISNFKAVAVTEAEHDTKYFHIKSFISDLLASMKTKLDHAGVSVSMSLQNDFEIFSSPNAISTIMQNLIDNSLTHAFKHINEGKISINVIQINDNIEVIYSDNGSGIPKDYQLSIYDPFFTTERGNGHTGLGLHLVYNLVYHQLKGYIDCVSNTDGTTFTLKLPNNKAITTYK